MSEDLDGDCPGSITVVMEPGDVCYFDAGLIHRGYNPLGVKRWTFVNVAWAARVPIMWDYEPVADAPQLRQVLAAHDIHPLARRYLQAFVDGVEESERSGRKASFGELPQFDRLSKL